MTNHRPALVFHGAPYNGSGLLYAAMPHLLGREHELSGPGARVALALYGNVDGWELSIASLESTYGIKPAMARSGINNLIKLRWLAREDIGGKGNDYDWHVARHEPFTLGEHAALNTFTHRGGTRNAPGGGTRNAPQSSRTSNQYTTLDIPEEEIPPRNIAGADESKPKHPHPIPNGWHPNGVHAGMASDRHLNANAIGVTFKAWANGEAERRADWNSTFSKLLNIIGDDMYPEDLGFVFIDDYGLTDAILCPVGERFVFAGKRRSDGE